MLIKKTWLSYVFWGLFSIILFVSVAFGAIQIATVQNSNDFFTPLLMNYGISIGSVLIAFGLVIVYDKFLKEKLDFSEFKSNKYLEIGALFLLLLVAALIRLILIVSTGSDYAGDTTYFDAAVTSGYTPLKTFSNAPYLYVNILGFLLKFLGNKLYVAFAFNAVIQLALIVFIFWYLSMAVGKIAAFIAVALASFLPGSFNQILNIDSDLMFVLFVCIYLLGLTLICEANKAGVIKDKWQTLFYILLGVLGGFVCFLDILGCSLVIITIVAYALNRYEDKWLPIQSSVYQIAWTIVSLIITLGVCLWFIPLNGIVDSVEAIVAYGFQFVPSNGFNLSIVTPNAGFYDSYALFALCAIWLIVFLKSKFDKAFPLTVLIVFATLFVVLGFDRGAYTSLISFAYVCMGSIGICSIGAFVSVDETISVESKKKELEKDNKRRSKEDKISKIKGEKTISLREENNVSANSNVSSVPKANINAEAKGDSIPKPPVVKPVFEKPVDTSVKFETSNSVKKAAEIPSINSTPAEYVEPRVETIIANDTRFSSGMDKGVSDSKVEEKDVKPVVAAPKPTTLLKNPLPGPKPRQPKEIDYDYRVSDKDMHYDIDIKGKEYYDV